MVILLNKREWGSTFEDIASSYLEKIGCVILNRNWTCRWCEIDIIAKINRSTICTQNSKTDKNPLNRSPCLVFVEVKFLSNRFYDISHVVSRKKLNSQKRAINCYLNAQPEHFRSKDLSFRFDLIVITKLQGKFLLQHFIGINF
ncbi:YraN family protein [candidate division WWE3 bacterium]|nr:YraN family protein [candidate division WWE3 bacterium]